MVLAYSKVQGVQEVGIGDEEVLANERVKRSIYLSASISLTSCSGNATGIPTCLIHGM